MFASLFSVVSAFLFLSANAAPVDAPTKPVELLAVAPKVIYPTQDTTWVVGAMDHVDWLTTDIPPEAQNYTVTILLGYLANDSENLDIDQPLKSQWPIMAGTAPITVPNVTIGSNYVVAVIGDSGDISQQFTIQPSSTESQ